MKDGKIGFAPHTVSSKTTLWEATLPSRTLSSTKTVMVASVVTWIIIVLLAGGAGAAFYFFLYDKLEDWFPNNAYYVVACSLAYALVVVLFLVYAIRPLLMLAMSAFPKHGGLATNENQKLLNIGTFAYLALAFWVYSVMIRSFKAKLAAKKEERKVEAAPDQTNQLLQLLKEVEQTNQIA